MHPYVLKRIKLNRRIGALLLWYLQRPICCQRKSLRSVRNRGALPIALLKSSSDSFIGTCLYLYLPADCSSRILDHHARARTQPLAFIDFLVVACPPIQAEFETADLRAEQPFARKSN
jgi:hypothetical protein